MEQYQVRAKDGSQYGPTDLTQLQAWARQGRITAADTIVLPDGITVAAQGWPPLRGYLATSTAKLPAPPSDDHAMHVNPEPPPVQIPQTNGLAVACFVLGLVSAVTMFWCFPISIPCGIVAVVLYGNARRNPVQLGLSTAGLITGIVGMSVSLLYLILVVAVSQHSIWWYR